MCKSIFILRMNTNASVLQNGVFFFVKSFCRPIFRNKFHSPDSAKESIFSKRFLPNDRKIEIFFSFNFEYLLNGEGSDPSPPS